MLNEVKHKGAASKKMKENDYLTDSLPTETQKRANIQSDKYKIELKRINQSARGKWQRSGTRLTKYYT